MGPARRNTARHASARGNLEAARSIAGRSGCLRITATQGRPSTRANRGRSTRLNPPKAIPSSRTRCSWGRNFPLCNRRSMARVALHPSRRTLPKTIPSKRVPAQTTPTSPTAPDERWRQGTSSNPMARSVRPGGGSAMLLLYMKDPLEKKPGEAVREALAEPPVVARLVLEIRSDGTRTIARGLAEDVKQGERVEVNAEGATPLQLLFSLLKSLGEVPALARSSAGGMLKR